MFEVSSLRELYLVHQVRIRDDRRNFNRKLLAFAAFVRFRLRELKLWPSKLDALRLQMTERSLEAPLVTHGERVVECVVGTPKLASANDEALIAAVGAAVDSTFANLVPGASLAVLADEFLNAGCRLRVALRLAHKRATAELTILHGMRRVEVRLVAGECEYQVLRVPADDYWTHYFSSISLSSNRVMIKAMTSSTLSLGPAGTGAEVRRFVVDLRTNQIVQNWELTGPGGVPLPGTGFDRAEPLRAFEGEGARLISSSRGPRD